MGTVDFLRLQIPPVNYDYDPVWILRQLRSILRLLAPTLVILEFSLRGYLGYYLSGYYNGMPLEPLPEFPNLLNLCVEKDAGETASYCDWLIVEGIIKHAPKLRHLGMPFGIRPLQYDELKPFVQLLKQRSLLQEFDLGFEGDINSKFLEDVGNVKFRRLNATIRNTACCSGDPSLDYEDHWEETGWSQVRLDLMRKLKGFRKHVLAACSSTLIQLEIHYGQFLIICQTPDGFPVCSSLRFLTLSFFHETFTLSDIDFASVFPNLEAVRLDVIHYTPFENHKSNANDERLRGAKIQPCHSVLNLTLYDPNITIFEDASRTFSAVTCMTLEIPKIGPEVPQKVAAALTLWSKLEEIYFYCRMHECPCKTTVPQGEMFQSCKLNRILNFLDPDFQS